MPAYGCEDSTGLSPDFPYTRDRLIISESETAFQPKRLYNGFFDQMSFVSSLENQPHLTRQVVSIVFGIPAIIWETIIGRDSKYFCVSTE